MDPHPDFAGTDLPRRAEVAGFRLTPLDGSALEEDYAAVTETGADLAGLWGDWPLGLTKAENAVDLAWHDREFTLGRSFSWIVRDAGGRYLGCLYLFPDPGRRGSAEAVAWVRGGGDRTAAMARILEAVTGWLEGQMPDGVVLRWRTSPQVARAGAAADV